MCLGVWAAEGIEAKRAKTEDRVVLPTSPGWAPGRRRWYRARPVYRALQPMFLLPRNLLIWSPLSILSVPHLVCALPGLIG